MRLPLYQSYSGIALQEQVLTMQPVAHELHALLSAGDSSTRERAWADFVQQYSRLLLHVARSIAGDHDVVMDRYTFMLEGLQQDDYRRLRGYIADNRSSFTTWLIVVARRLMLDQHRQRYGRAQGSTDSSTERHRERRRLTDLVGDELGLENLQMPAGERPDAALERSDQTARLQKALAELTAEERLLLRLRYEEEVSVPALARMLKEPSPFRVYRRLDKLLDRLRRRLTEYGIDGSAP